MSDAVIKVEGLSKKYLLQHQRAGRSRYVSLRDVLAEKAKAFFQNRKSEIGNQNSTEEFWALKDVSFEIKRGEAVGIIGRNGAGKSTLLKILSRITKPTKGRIEIEGRLASLLEVGTGFHPELTGRENIYLNGAVLGMHRAEIRDKFDEIVAFAEVEKFLDTPVKRYSSGMYMRLAFAVAAHLDQEILIVDEVLAVGDAQFQKKCLGKMQEVSKGGRTLLFVSHNMSSVLQLTKVGILLDKGRVSYNGPTQEAVERYTAGYAGGTAVEFDVESKPRKYEGTGEARLLSLKFNRPVPIFNHNEDFQFIAKVRALVNISHLRFSMTVFTSDGIPVGSCFGPDLITIFAGDVAEVLVDLPCPHLSPGHYYCGLAIGRGDHKTGHTDYDVVMDTLHFEISPAEGDGGTVSTWTRGWGSIVFPHLNQTILPKQVTL